MTLDPATWTFPTAALDGLPWPDLWASLLLVLVLWICRKIVIGLVRIRTDLPPYVLRRWVVSSRNVVLFLILIGLVLIWAPQLRTFALSIAAVAVAIVVATKELILCVSGALVRASTRAFTVGDWIEVAGLRGEVVDHTLLATTLQEFQPNSFHYTGRTAIIPNSLFVTTPLRNLTVVRDYTFHTFALTFEPDLALDGLETDVARIVESHYGPHRDEAARANARIERRSGVDILDPETRVRPSTSDIGKYRITITLFCPTRLAEPLEDAITWDVVRHCRMRATADAESTAG
jgi:small-conductance mechanosensitive channel